MSHCNQKNCAASRPVLPTPATAATASSPSTPSPPVYAASTAPKLCRFFFLQGHCRNGESCLFSHDACGMTREEALKTIPCPFYSRDGICRYGDYCKLKHEETPLAENDDAFVCGICLENVYAVRRKFGLLSCCNHVFCFDCLMEWRKEGSEDVRSRRVCPTCRKSSDYVVPSPVYASNEEEKQRILSTYKNRLATIPCRHFDGDLGSCSFGRDCFYAHFDEDGKDIKSEDLSMKELYEKRNGRRRRRDRDRFISDVDLMSDLLLVMELSRYFDSGGEARSSHTSHSDHDLSEIDSDEDDDDDNPFLRWGSMDFISMLSSLGEFH